MTIAVRNGAHAIDTLVAAVRERARAATTARVGVRLGRLDITVVDLYEEDR